jgi:hypothetical protein
MDPEVRKKWVEALRSGKYEQNKHGLCAVDPDGGDGMAHCCLGVLCELALEGGALSVARRKVDESGRVWFVGRSAYLPGDVVKWSGLPDSNPTVWFSDAIAHLGDRDTQRARASGALSHDFVTLSELNDAGVSFEGIAAIVENCKLFGVREGRADE